MSDLKIIPVSKIFVPERLRAVEEDHALAIQASILEHGLLNPITVRSTPNQDKGAKPYTLVAGAHRLRAIELNDANDTIEAMVVEADGAEAQLIEIEENVFRNDLSSLDRAVFIQTYRDVWEQKYGKIQRGNPQFSNSVNLTELLSDEAARGFSAHVAARLGLSKASVERSDRIAKNLPKPLREKLRGTPAADNQSLLLKLAKLPPKQRNDMARAIDLAKGDVAAAIELLADKPKPKLSDAQKRISAVIGNFSAAGRKEKIAVLRELARLFPDEVREAGSLEAGDRDG